MSKLSRQGRIDASVRLVAIALRKYTTQPADRDAAAAFLLAMAAHLYAAHASAEAAVEVVARVAFPVADEAAA